EIVLTQAPKNGSVVEVVLCRGVIVFLVDPRPVIHVLLIAREGPRERLGTLQADERLQILFGKFVVTEGIEKNALEGCFVVKHLIGVARRGHHVDPALRVLRSAYPDM